MALPEPKPGLVFRYDYLWSAEDASGRDPSKERPACLLAAIDLPSGPRFVVILPITHTAPVGDAVGIEIPLSVCQALRLDEQRNWIIVSEHNVDEWPTCLRKAGAVAAQAARSETASLRRRQDGGIARIPGQRGQFSYGFIPPGLFARVKEQFLELAAQGRTPGVRRE